MSLERFRSSIVFAGADDTAERAAQLMRDRHVGCLVVARNSHPMGIVTDRDLVVRVMAEGRDPSAARVGEFVTYAPMTVSVHDGIETVAERMRRHGVRRLPIVDDDGGVVGIVTADDLFVLLGGELAAVSGAIENPADSTESR